MKALKKKQVVLTALVAMIGLAGYFNWMYENSDNGSVTDSDEVALGEAGVLFLLGMPLLALIPRIFHLERKNAA